jgi:hypothetical protein
MKKQEIEWLAALLAGLGDQDKRAILASLKKQKGAATAQQ